MNEIVSEKEKNKILELCISDPERACAIVQEFIDYLQIVPVSIYASAKGKSKRTILYQAKRITGFTILDRRFLSLNH